MQKAIFLFVFLLFSIDNIFPQQKVAEYIDLSPNIFSSFDTPIGIAILPFTYQGFQTDLDAKFYNALTSALGKKSSFIITFYKNLNKIKNSWKIKSWDPENIKLLRRLESELDIKLIVYAVTNDPEDKSFELKIVNTRSGKEVFNKKYFSSSNSNIINDAIRLFTEKKIVVYKDVIRTGAENETYKVNEDNSNSQSETESIEQVTSAYKTVKIGDQTWMTENLNVDHYRNGDPIPEVQDPEQWKTLKSGAWCYYENKRGYGKKYCKLYNWYAVNDPRGLAPEGWHIPTLDELQTLATTVNQDGNALKSIGQGLGTGAGTNTSGFSAMMAGNRGKDGIFTSLDDIASFWSSTAGKETEAANLYITYDINSVQLSDYDNKADGNSVRCVKDFEKGSTHQSEKTSDEDVNSMFKTIRIGEQTWMGENLNVDHYRNGDPIPEVKDPVKWKYRTTGAWCYNKSNRGNGKKYGKLYNWYAVNDPRGLAPKGWHIPTKSKFKTLAETVNEDANALKAIGQGSVQYGGAGTNTVGFSALLSGIYDANGYFVYEGNAAYFWSSTESSGYGGTAYSLYSSAFSKAYSLYIISAGSNIYLSDYDKGGWLSIRCVKD